MTAQSNRFVTTFTSDERGGVAVIFGLMFAALVMCVGIAVDFGRTTHAGNKLLAAADAASLAGGRALLDGRLSDAQVKAVALKFFDENMKQNGQFGTVKKVSVAVDRSSGAVTVDATTTVGMTVTRTAGFDSVDLPVKSSVLSDQKDIELGMALDVTGSMGGQKIIDLRNAAKDLVDILMPDGGAANKVRIGLAPYAASVNAGAYAGTVTNRLSSNCVHERGGSQAFTDAAPSAGTFLGFTARMVCPSAKVEPLTTDKVVLKNSIDTYRAAGMTAGHLGAAWASYLVSPEWKDIWPAASEPVAYGDAKTLKAIILMTDGEFNTQYINANGNSANQARDVCRETKDRDVVIYAVGFQSPAAAEALLKDCASTTDHYFSARNGSELRQAFIEIAQQLNNLRLTQ